MADTAQPAGRFAELFQAIYLTYHRRDGPRSELQGASRAVLNHLAVTGPLTVGEAAVHLDRAQSVISEIVDGVETPAAALGRRRRPHGTDHRRRGPRRGRPRPIRLRPIRPEGPDMSTTPCESCGMPIETGRYRAH